MGSEISAINHFCFMNLLTFYMENNILQLIVYWIFSLNLPYFGIDEVEWKTDTNMLSLAKFVT